MRRIISAIAALVFTMVSMLAQSATGYQYWFDNDTLSMQAGPVSADKLTLNPDLSDMPHGLHFFNLRLHDADGVWGAPYRKSFLTVDSRSGAVAYEYWIDNDFDNKVSEEITTQDAVFNVDMASYPHGLHYFNLRLRTNSDEWGGIYRRSFLATPTITGAVAYEYWIDEDYDNRTEGEIADGENVYEITLDGLKKGLHRFSYRMKTIDGEWGSVYSQHFYYTSRSSFTDYEYWLDDDYTKKVSGKATANTTSFNVNLDSLPHQEYHKFSLRVRDDTGEWGSVYRKFLIFYNDTAKAPVVGYHHYLNGKDLGYVPVKNNPSGKYTFMVDLPEGEGIDISNIPLKFDGDNVSVSDTINFDYKIRIDSELGWTPVSEYLFDNDINFSTKAESVDVPSSVRFARPSRTEFKAIKFDTDGRILYMRASRKATLDIYRNGKKVTTVPADSITETNVITLEKGTYFGILYDVAKGEGEVILHLLDTDNKVPKPDIKFEDGWVEITDRNKDAEIHYTIDDADISIDSPIYKERFEMRRNGVIRAMAVLPGLDLDPSEVAIDSISSYVVLPPSVSIGDNGTTITLTANTEGSSLWYAIDDSNTENFRGYESPFEMTGNGTIYAQGRKDGWFDSSVVVTTINDKQMPNPHIAHDASSNRVSITCAKQPATILYTLDDPDVKGHGIEFKEEFVFDRNGTIRAIAIDPNGNLNDSGIETVAIDWKKVETPVVRFTDSMVVEITSDSHSGVKTYYRLDGQTPTESDTEYNTPFALRQNANVVARSFKEGYTPSEPGSFNYVHADYITQSPKISIDGLKVTLDRTTDGSTLWYGINESNPDKFELYREPFDIPGNCTVYANARKGGMYDSSVVTLVIDWNKVSKPIAKYAAHQLTLTCDDGQATIYYSTDDNAAETEFTRYENPLPLDADCNVRFLARRDYFIDSETGSFEFVLADYKESNATISKDYKNRKVTVNSDDCTVRVTINGIAEEHQTPAMIDVTPDMESIRVVALARNADRYDSDPVEEKLVFHLPPVVSYDGHTISVSVADSDPA
ncbi:MAG: chitobiase/beta-hexosaminidase C-terminal domain-containing protein, partial [Muribaculum sp.]|nr:chitobiase/beta-hexosaminidase C-terminal domain-containing protein [Muribaculum sp.]